MLRQSYINQCHDKMPLGLGQISLDAEDCPPNASLSPCGEIPPALKGGVSNRHSGHEDWAFKQHEGTRQGQGISPDIRD